MQKQTADREWDAVISSPLSRCHKFAARLSQQQQITLHTETGLREICFGDWEGKTAEQIAAVSPQALQDHVSSFHLLCYVYVKSGLSMY